MLRYESGRFEPALHVDLPVDPRQMVLHRFDAQARLACDGLIVVPLLQQPQDVTLAAGQFDRRWIELRKAQ